MFVYGLGKLTYLKFTYFKQKTKSLLGKKNHPMEANISSR